VKERRPGQSAEEAMSVNAAGLETVVEHVEFCFINVGELKNPAANHVWQVVALRESGRGIADILAVSEVRTVRFAAGRSDLSSVISADPAHAPAPEPAFVSARSVSATEDSACPNGDLETGTFQGWQGYYGSRLNSPVINLNNMSPGIVPGLHTICGPASDPYVVGLNQVGEGSWSARIGNYIPNGKATILAYTFTVTPQNQIFSFMYALVLQDPGHAADEQPFFVYYIVPGSSIYFGLPNMPVVMQKIVADGTNPFFKTANGVIYRGWTPTCVDLSAHLGQTMTVVFAVADCAPGPHFGYAYVDGLCKPNNAVASFTMPDVICGGETLWMDATDTANETSYFLSIAESDASWNVIQGTEVYEWFVAAHPDQINLTSWYATKGQTFKCNTYYRVKLAVVNDCTQWNESVHLLHVKCPPVTAGPDLCVSCTPNGVLTEIGLGNLFTPGYSYVWTPAAGLNNPASPTPKHAQGTVPYPIRYTVKVTDPAGCTNTAYTDVYCKPPGLTLTMEQIGCCSTTLIANATEYKTLTWSTGQTGTTQIAVTQPGTYSVTAANKCGSVTKSITVTLPSMLMGYPNPIAANSKFWPPNGSSNPPLEDKLHIKDVITGNGAASVPNAYNANAYKLEIFDRWGTLFKTIMGQSCDGFPNWSIAWDGTDSSNNIVPQGTYTWMLHFKNCQYTQWTEPKQRRFADRHCVKWAYFLGIRLWCRQYDVPDGTTVDEIKATGDVTVIQ
jgi:hypothetical protein